MDLSTKMFWALDNGRARTINYPISVHKKSHSVQEESKHIDQELRDDRKANMERIRQNLFGENRSSHQNECKNVSDEEHQHLHINRNQCHKMLDKIDGGNDPNEFRDEEFLYEESIDIDLIIEGKEKEKEKNESDFVGLAKAKVANIEVLNECVKVNGIDPFITVDMNIQSTAAVIDQNYFQNQIVPSEFHEHQTEKSVSLTFVEPISVENEENIFLPSEMTLPNNLRETSVPATMTPQLQGKKKMHFQTVTKFYTDLESISPFYFNQISYASLRYWSSGILFHFIFPRIDSNRHDVSVYSNNRQCYRK